jgi:hypothetical protein
VVRLLDGNEQFYDSSFSIKFSKERGVGVVSIKQLLPTSIFQPDDAFPISRLWFPASAKMTRIGFDRKPGDPLKFEGETQVKVRMEERLWRYKLKGTTRNGEKNSNKANIRESRRWRLEILVDARNSDRIQPPHQVVVAQIPYGNGWVQPTALKKYTKKTLEKEEIDSQLPELDDLDDVESKLEAAQVFDPWEKGQYYVAGISYPRGYLKLLWSNPRNAEIDYVIGVCPDFKATRDELRMSPEVERLLEMTRKGTIAFWKRGAPGQRPHLFDETKEAAPELMLLSIHQALAGPREYSKDWQGQPVWKLVERLYCNHLNNRNRKNRRTPKEEQFTED